MRRKSGYLLLAGLFVVGISGCSGDEEKTEEAVEKSDDEGEAAAGDEAAPPAEEADTAEEAAAPSAELAPAPAPSPAPIAAPPPSAPEAPGFDGPKVVRWVTSYALNVRSGPGKEFPVIGHVKRGDKLEVVMNGEWAKLGEGRFIATTRLAEKNPGPLKWGSGKAKKKGKK